MASHFQPLPFGSRPQSAFLMAPSLSLGSKSKTLLLPTTYWPDGVQKAQPTSAPDDSMIRPRTWYTGSSSCISRIVAVPPSRVGYVLPTSICMLLSLIENLNRLSRGSGFAIRWNGGRHLVAVSLHQHAAPFPWCQPREGFPSRLPRFGGLGAASDIGGA